VAVAADPLGGIAAVIDDGLLGDDEDPHRPAQGVDVHGAVVTAELHQVQTRQIAGGVVHEHELAARIGGVDGTAFRAGVPAVDGGVILHAGVAADVAALGRTAQQLGGAVLHQRLARGDGVGLPGPILDGGGEELIRHPHRQVSVLEHDRPVRLAVEIPVVPGVDQGPGLLLLGRLALDEFPDVGVIAPQRLHLGRPAGLAAGLDHRGDLVEHPHEAQRPGRRPPAAEAFPAGPQRRKVGAGPRAVLEQHRLRRGEAHDVLHRVVDALDEARRRLGELIAALGFHGPAGLLVPVEVAFRTGHALAVVQPHVEPHRGVERPVLVQAQPAQLVAERLGVGVGGEHPVLLRPFGDGAHHPVDQVANGRFALIRAHLPVEVLADDHVRRQLAPAGGNLHLVLLEDDLALLVLDDGGPLVPGDLVERVAPRLAEGTFHAQAILASPLSPSSLVVRGKLNRHLPLSHMKPSLNRYDGCRREARTLGTRRGMAYP